VTVARRPAPTLPPEPRVRGVFALVGSTDHKSLGLRLFGIAGVFFLAGGMLALLVRSELAVPGMQVLSHQEYSEIFTMHGSTMVYLVVQPLALALGVYLVPLMIGAADLIAPRLALLCVLMVPGGGLIMYMGFLTTHGAGPDGWTAFLPLSNSGFTQGIGMDMWVLGVIVANAGQLVLAGVILATILLRRAPGMTMLRLPPFVWTEIVTCLMVLVAFPSLIAAMLLIYLERQFGLSFDPVVYLHVFWFYGHPNVYVMFFPFVGCVAEVMAVFSRKRFFGYNAFVFSLLAFAMLSMSVWGHHMFTTGRSQNEYFATTSTALAIAAGVEYFDLIGTMWGGAVLLRTPMLFALGFLVQFLVGGLTGIIIASPPLNYSLNDTFFIVGHFHYTLFAGSIFGLFAGIYYWFPKATGVLLRERLGQAHFWLMALGTNLTFMPMFALGYEGMVRRVPDYPHHAGWTWLNELSTAGSALIAVSTLVFLANLWISLRRPRPAGNDPWEGHTLEWWTTSPPPRHNFLDLPPIRSFSPLLDLRLEAERERAP
jgi:cytochrome c oxidase subunit 1